MKNWNEEKAIWRAAMISYDPRAQTADAYRFERLLTRAGVFCNVELTTDELQALLDKHIVCEGKFFCFDQEAFRKDIGGSFFYMPTAEDLGRCI